jgi:hypothetical protein
VERLVDKIDRLCESIEKMAQPKKQRLYDAVFAGGQDNDQKEPAEKEEPIIDVVDQGEASILQISEEQKDG